MLKNGLGYSNEVLFTKAEDGPNAIVYRSQSSALRLTDEVRVGVDGKGLIGLVPSNLLPGSQLSHFCH